MHLRHRRVHRLVVEPELVVVGEVVGTGRPQDRTTEHARPAVVADEQALHVAGRERRSGGDQVVERLRRLEAGLLEQALAVDEELHVDDLGDGPQVAVVRQAADHPLVEVALGVAEDAVERHDLPAQDHVDVRPVAGLEHVGSVVGEQRRGEGAVVVGSEPLDLDVGVLVGGGVALDRFLDALLAVAVVPLRQRRQVAAPRATTGPGGRASERRTASAGDSTAAGEHAGGEQAAAGQQTPATQGTATDRTIGLVHRMVSLLRRASRIEHRFAPP